MLTHKDGPSSDNTDNLIALQGAVLRRRRLLLSNNALLSPGAASPFSSLATLPGWGQQHGFPRAEDYPSRKAYFCALIQQALDIMDETTDDKDEETPIPPPM